MNELDRLKKNMILLYEKEVDYSLLTRGFTITKETLSTFIDIYGNIPPSEKKEIEINLEGIIYKGEIRHINQKKVSNDYQILYRQDFSNHLKTIFPQAFEILENIKNTYTGNKKKIFPKLPSDKKEYILVYYNPNNKQLLLKKKDNINSFFPIIQKFIQQADEGNNLKVSGYPKNYEDLKVDVSFSKGDYAPIPRISFLYQGQKTSNGIYPVFLYYKVQKILILSYCISETNNPAINWNLPQNTETIASYFQENDLGVPERYGDSFVFKVYNPSQVNGSELDNDLKEIISSYKNIMRNEDVSKVDVHEPFDIQRVQEIKLTGLLFNDELLYRYALSLLTKPFVILSGLSGSGKTRLAMTFAKWLSKDDSQIKIVSVGSDWSNREYLLGYPNALDCGKYIEPENGVLRFILQAIENPTKPYFLILDEMNLSYVERYFADFLSTMESHECITLHPNNSDWKDCKIPSQITLPPNLYITGTINVDETTYMFSPKVLDRANVIEFRISEEDMEEFLAHCKPLKPDMVNSKGSSMEIGFTTLSRDNHFEHNDKFTEILKAFFKELKLAGAEFGYRTASEIYRFITLAKKLDVEWDNDKLIDIVVMQKMLPKLHGSRKKMQPILIALWKLCLKTEYTNLLIDNEEIQIDNQFKYPLSATKIWQMYKNAKDNGFTSYAEA